jgi:hypothetical protein
MFELACDCGRDRLGVSYVKTTTSWIRRYQCNGCRRTFDFDTLTMNSKFIPSYPHLVKTLKIMFLDNDFDLKPESEWLWPENVDELERLASDSARLGKGNHLCR